MFRIKEHLEKTDEGRKQLSKLMELRNKLSPALAANFDEFFKTQTNFETIEKFMQDFFQSIQFKEGKGVLANLEKYGKFNQYDAQGNRIPNTTLISQIKSHVLLLKQLTQSAAFYERNLRQNPIGEKMIPIIIQEFMKKIDSQLFTNVNAIHPDILVDREATKAQYQRSNLFSLNEFLADIQTLFGDSKSTEKSPILLDIYPKISISIDEILKKLKENGVVTNEDSAERLFQMEIGKSNKGKDDCSR